MQTYQEKMEYQKNRNINQVNNTNNNIKRIAIKLLKPESYIRKLQNKGRTITELNNATFDKNWNIILTDLYTVEKCNNYI